MYFCAVNLLLTHKNTTMLYSIQNTIDKANVLLISAQIWEYNLVFDIDTGATYNIIFDYVYNQIKEGFVDMGKSINMFGIDGKRTDNKTVKAELGFDKTIFTTEFQVVDAIDAVTNFQNDFGIQLHGILGVQFLKDNNCVIDFANKTIKIGD